MTVVTKSNGTAMAVWGDRGDVRELDTRLATMLPGADKLSTNQRLALAQGSLAHGLDPFNGEIWMIPGRGLMIGVKGLRKKAREQVQGNFWVEFVEITDADYRKRQRIPDGALAYEARLFDSENLRTYAATCEQLLKAGIPWEAVNKMVGAKPYTVGIGVLAAGEQTKMQPAQCAMKRAEADALKRRFDVPFGLAVEADSDPAEAGEWIENEPAQQQPAAKTAAERTPEEQAHHEAGLAAMYGTDEQAATAVVDAAPVVVSEPTPAIDDKPANRASATASLKVRRRDNVAAWEEGTRKLAELYPKYADANGRPNNFHILGAAKKCLFDAVTDDNFIAVLSAITSRAAEQAALPA